MKKTNRRNCRTALPLRSCCLSDMAAASVLSVLFLSPLCLAAPQVPSSERIPGSKVSETAESNPSVTMINPFGASDDEHRLLQSYIKSNLKGVQLSQDLTSREQEIFFLFSLHDYDKSGQMDGLEMMKLLSDFLSHHSLGPQTADSVVSMVDIILQTRDLNQDGLLDPSELLSPPTEPRNVQQQLPPRVEEDSISHSAPADTSQNQISEQQAQGFPDLEQKLHEQLQDGTQQDLVQEVKPQEEETQPQGEQELRLNRDEQVVQAQQRVEAQELEAEGVENEQELHIQGIDDEQEQRVLGMEEEQEPHTEENQEQHVPVHQGQPEI